MATHSLSNFWNICTYFGTLLFWPKSKFWGEFRGKIKNRETRSPSFYFYLEAPERIRKDSHRKTGKDDVLRKKFKMPIYWQICTYFAGSNFFRKIKILTGFSLYFLKNSLSRGPLDGLGWMSNNKIIAKQWQKRSIFSKICFRSAIICTHPIFFHVYKI